MDYSNDNQLADKKKMPAGLIAGLAAIVIAIIVLVAFLIIKNPLYYRLATSRAVSNEFKQSQSYLKKSGGEKAEVLSDYVDLRITINSHYATLLAEFNIETLRQWNETATEIKNSSELLPEDVRDSALKLSETLWTICSMYDEYQALSGDVLSLMDIFLEINNIYTKDEAGKNQPFTILEERAKINNWSYLSDKILNYSDRIPSGDIYLLTYMLKEAQGEITDISDVMNSLEAKGFKDTDTVIIGGNNHRSFASVSNSDGTTLNLAEKVTYSEYLEAAVYRALTESLAEFYVGI